MNTLRRAVLKSSCVLGHCRQVSDQNNPCIWQKEKQTRSESHCDSREKDVQRKPPKVMAEKPHPQLHQQLSGSAEMPLCLCSGGLWDTKDTTEHRDWVWTAWFRLLCPGHREQSPPAHSLKAELCSSPADTIQSHAGKTKGGAKGQGFSFFP